MEDAGTLRTATVVVATPEKLDFALRNDPSIIDDVALVILDEGHMLRPDERGVRYEALVQRLLLRKDCDERRMVCLSALFPSPEEMKELVQWMRRDVAGEAVHGTWRPTRQRFGLLRWRSNRARLEIAVGKENPFVPGFIEAVEPPRSGRRRKPFPADKNELVLATSWCFVGQGKNVLVYCPLRRSVETLGRLVDKCVKQGVLGSLGAGSDRVRAAIAAGEEWLGAEHPAVLCLRYGVALHHGGLPRAFLSEVERLMHSGDCRVIIASPTLAQGLNLSASVLLVPSIWRGKQVIPAEEFANVAGRAGRAFVDVEGLILHVVWSGAPYEVKWRVDQWWGLVRRAGAPIVRSGLLMLAMQIYERMATAHGVPMAEVMDYVTGNARAWDLGEAQLSGLGVPQEEWERELASLDAAVLVLVDAATEAGDLRNAVGRVLEGSLFVRQAEDDAAASVLVARAVHIWSRTERVHRQGFHAAGVGLKAGLFLDKNRAWLLERLREAEGALEAGDEGGAAREIVGFAARVFEVAPFRPRVLPKGWQSALEQWVSGSAWALVVKVCGEKASEDLQDGFVYRLPWAMEASRVHALAVGDEGAESIVGLAAVAAEVGSANRSEMILLRSGLESRAAARAAVYSTGAEFVFGYRVRD